METPPEHPNIYQGNQVLINSDRLVFNAKQDSILLYSEKSIGFSTKGNFHFDTDNSQPNKFIVNAPKIYLGIKNLSTGELPNQPAVLGNELSEILDQILLLVEMILIDIDTNISYVVSTAPGKTSPGPDNKMIIDQRKYEIDIIKGQLENMMSKNVYIAHGQEF